MTGGSGVLARWGVPIACARWTVPHHQNVGPDRHQWIERGDLVVLHPDTAVRRVASDRCRVARAVDADQARGGDVERPRPHRIAGSGPDHERLSCTPTVRRGVVPGRVDLLVVDRPVADLRGEAGLRGGDVPGTHHVEPVVEIELVAVDVYDDGPPQGVVG